MEDYTFRPSNDPNRTPSPFLAPTGFPDISDAAKSSLKFDNPISPFFGAQDFRKPRLNSFESLAFFPFNKEDESFLDMQGQLKMPEAMGHDYPYFGAQPQLDIGFDMNMSNKPQDYTGDFNRINRSRGPSFNIGSGRKASEDFFAGSFDLINLFRNQDQRERKHSYEALEARFSQPPQDDYRNAQFMPNIFPAGGYPNMLDPNYQFGYATMGMENPMNPMVTQNALNAQTMPNPYEMQQNQVSTTASESTAQQSAEEPKTKKKRKLNNAQETAGQETEEPASVQLKKAKSENKKGQIKHSKTTVDDSTEKKSPAPKGSRKKGGKNAMDGFDVKTENEGFGEKEEKSTVASSNNVSPNPQKEMLPGFYKSKSAIMDNSTFNHFKKPESAQELLGGMSLPAEVEEYINNSKIFNQIRAPVVRKIGTLTIEERKAKIEKYLEKRKRRSWNKRVNYDCRKKVADNRLRIKGRFVTKEQAFGMLEALGIYPDPEKITNDEIKAILTSKFGGVTKKKHAGQGNANGQEKIEEGMGSEGESGEYDSEGESYLKD